MRIKGQYFYKAYQNVGHGIMVSVRVQCFDSLSDARKFCRALGITDGEILRYHIFRGCEDKSYSII